MKFSRYDFLKLCSATSAEIDTTQLVDVPEEIDGASLLGRGPIPCESVGFRVDRQTVVEAWYRNETFKSSKYGLKEAWIEVTGSGEPSFSGADFAKLRGVTLRVLGHDFWVEAEMNELSCGGGGWRAKFIVNGQPKYLGRAEVVE